MTYEDWPERESESDGLDESSSVRIINDPNTGALINSPVGQTRIIEPFDTAATRHQRQARDAAGKALTTAIAAAEDLRDWLAVYAPAARRPDLLERAEKAVSDLRQVELRMEALDGD